MADTIDRAEVSQLLVELENGSVNTLNVFHEARRIIRQLMAVNAQLTAELAVLKAKHEPKADPKRPKLTAVPASKPNGRHPPAKG